jgi:hypothetical protein
VVVAVGGVVVVLAVAHFRSCVGVVLLVVLVVGVGGAAWGEELAAWGAHWIWCGVGVASLVRGVLVGGVGVVGVVVGAADVGGVRVGATVVVDVRVGVCLVVFVCSGFVAVFLRVVCFRFVDVVLSAVLVVPRPGFVVVLDPNFVLVLGPLVRAGLFLGLVAAGGCARGAVGVLFRCAVGVLVPRAGADVLLGLAVGGGWPRDNGVLFRRAVAVVFLGVVSGGVAVGGCAWDAGVLFRCAGVSGGAL